MPYAKSLVVVVHILARLAQRTQNTLVYSTRVSQGSVATCSRCDDIFNYSFIVNFPQSVPVKKRLKIG